MAFARAGVSHTLVIVTSTVLAFTGCSGDDDASSPNEAGTSTDAAVERHDAAPGDVSSNPAVDVGSDRPATVDGGGGIEVSKDSTPDASEEKIDNDSSLDSAVLSDAPNEVVSEGAIDVESNDDARVDEDADAATALPDDADATTADEPDASVAVDDAAPEEAANAPDGGITADDSSADESSDAAPESAVEDVAPESAVVDAGESGGADASEGPFDNPSCVGLTSTCGPSSSQSCCSRAAVPGGTFKRSYDGVTNTNQGYPATVSSFNVDRFEVTVGRFRTFVAAGFGTQAKPPANGSGALPGTAGSGWSASDNSNLVANSAALIAGLKCNATYATWTDAAGSNENRPINCVTWFEALAFCIWDGARLPTEAEWNYAAAGGTEQRVYPWSVPATSSTISDANASYWIDPTVQCFGDGVNGCSLDDLIFAGSKPAGIGRWGHSDLGGNVWEWTRDSYDSPYAITSCVDCVDLSKGTSRVIRGGSFFGTASTLMAAGRAQGTAGTRVYTVGLRCTR